MTNLSKLGSFRARTCNKLVQMIWNDPKAQTIDSSSYLIVWSKVIFPPDILNILSVIFSNVQSSKELVNTITGKTTNSVNTSKYGARASWYLTTICLRVIFLMLSVNDYIIYLLDTFKKRIRLILCLIVYCMDLDFGTLTYPPPWK